jgi:hypothetical protein
MAPPNWSYARSPQSARSAQPVASPLDAPPPSQLGAAPTWPGCARQGPAGTEVQAVANGVDLAVAVPAVLNVLDPGLGDDQDLVNAVLEQAEAIQSSWPYGSGPDRDTLLPT